MNREYNKKQKLTEMNTNYLDTDKDTENIRDNNINSDKSVSASGYKTERDGSERIKRPRHSVENDFSDEQNLPLPEYV